MLVLRYRCRIDRGSRSILPVSRPTFCVGNRNDQQPIVDESVDDPKGDFFDRVLSVKAVEAGTVSRMRCNLLQRRIHGCSKSDGRLHA